MSAGTGMAAGHACSCVACSGNSIHIPPRGGDFTIMRSSWSPAVHNGCGTGLSWSFSGFFQWHLQVLIWKPQLLLEYMLTGHFIFPNQPDSIPGTRIPKSWFPRSPFSVPSQLRGPKGEHCFPFPFWQRVRTHNCLESHGTRVFL